MERLTRRDGHGCAYFDNDDVLIRGANGTFHQKKDMTAHYIHDRFVALDKVIDRLAAYEDTELEPGEIVSVQEEPWCVFYFNRHCNLDGDFCSEGPSCPQEMSPEDAVRLLKLAQAEKDGRLVVLPCNVGDTVYHITTCEHFPQILDGTMYGPYGEPGTATGYYCPCELSETCPFDADDFDCNINKKKFAVFEDEVVSFYIDDSGTSIALGYSGSVSNLDFGKTVFLTREEAEAALKKREEADNEAVR